MKKERPAAGRSLRVDSSWLGLLVLPDGPVGGVGDDEGDFRVSPGFLVAHQGAVCASELLGMIASIGNRELLPPFSGDRKSSASVTVVSGFDEPRNAVSLGCLGIHGKPPFWNPVPP